MQGRAPTCPRCDYDLSGESVRWIDASPLRCTCPECGLDFETADVMREDRRVNPRHVEHAPRGIFGVGLLGAAWRTCVWTILPPIFWSRVRLHHVVVPRRLMWWLAIVLLGTHVLVCVVTNTMAVRQYGVGLTLTLRDDIRADLASPWIAPVGDVQQLWRGGTTWGHTWVPPWRGGRWGVAYVPLLAASALYPLLMLVLKDTRARAKVSRGHIARAFVFGLGWMVPLMLVSGATVIGVRYWFAGGITPTWFWVGVGVRQYFVPDLIQLATIPLGLMWIVWWWGCAVRSWRVRRPFAVWLAATIAALLGVAIAMAISPRVVMMLAV